MQHQSLPGQLGQEQSKCVQGILPGSRARMCSLIRMDLDWWVQMYCRHICHHASDRGCAMTCGVVLAHFIYVDEIVELPRHNYN